MYNNPKEKALCYALYNFMSERIDTIKPFSVNPTKFVYSNYIFKDKNDMLLKIKSDVNIAICCLYEIICHNTDKQFIWKTFRDLIDKQK